MIRPRPLLIWQSMQQSKPQKTQFSSIQISNEGRRILHSPSPPTLEQLRQYVQRSSSPNNLQVLHLPHKHKYATSQKNVQKTNRFSLQFQYLIINISRLFPSATGVQMKQPSDPNLRSPSFTNKMKTVDPEPTESQNREASNPFDRILGSEAWRRSSKTVGITTRFSNDDKQRGERRKRKSYDSKREENCCLVVNRDRDDIIIHIINKLLTQKILI